MVDPKGEPHPTIPHLYRKPAPRTASGDIYPYLPSTAQSPAPKAAAQESDAARGGVSPLGGKAR